MKPLPPERLVALLRARTEAGGLPGFLHAAAVAAIASEEAADPVGALLARADALERRGSSARLRLELRMVPVLGDAPAAAAVAVRDGLQARWPDPTPGQAAVIRRAQAIIELREREDGPLLLGLLDLGRPPLCEPAALAAWLAERSLEVPSAEALAHLRAALRASAPAASTLLDEVLLCLRPCLESV